MAASDRFAHVRERSNRHREEHGPECSVHPTGSGPMLGVLASATGAQRILEVGCGLGYSALWLAVGCTPSGVVETVEADPLHVQLATETFDQEGVSDRVNILAGQGLHILPGLATGYDLIFADGDINEYLFDLDQFLRLLRPGGLLVSANLFLGQHVPDLPGLDQAAGYRNMLLNDRRWLTAFLPGGLALSAAVRSQ